MTRTNMPVPKVSKQVADSFDQRAQTQNSTSKEFLSHNFLIERALAYFSVAAHNFKIFSIIASKLTVALQVNWSKVPTM